MRLKFKPNLAAPRGTSGSGDGVRGGGAGVGVRGGRGGGRRRSAGQREKRLSHGGGDESRGATGGESSSEVDTGGPIPTRTRRRRRNTSSSSTSTPAPVVQTESLSERTTEQQDKEASITVDEPPSASITSEQNKESISHNTLVTTTATIISDVSATTSSDRTTCTTTKATHESSTSETRAQQDVAVDKPSDLSSKRTTAGSSLTRKTSPSAAGGLSGAQKSGGGGVRLRKKVAPKVVSTRPKRTTASSTQDISPLKSTSKDTKSDSNVVESTSTPNTGETASESRMFPEASSSVTGGKESRQLETSKKKTDSVAPSRRTSRTKRSSRLASEQSTDEAISNTLNEVLSNAHSHSPEIADTGLSGIVHGVQPQLNLFTHPEENTPSYNTQSTSSTRGNEASTSIASSSKEQSKQDESQANTHTQETTSTDGREGHTDTTSSSTPPSKKARTSPTKVPESSVVTEEPSARSGSKEKDLEKESSVESNGGRTSRASSETSQTRRSRSRTGSVCSEVGGVEGSGQKGGKTRKTGTKRKKRSREYTPSVDGGDGQTDSASSTPSKKPRTSVAKVREAPDRSTMTMMELIYYNPTANPMSSTAEEKKRRKGEGDGSRQPSQQGSRCSSVQPQLDTSLGLGGDTGGGETGRREGGEGEVNVKEGDMDRIVPQLRIGDDGNIIVDESSMLMDTTAQAPLEDVGELTMYSRHTTSASYRNRYRVTKWTKEETGRFFKALSQVGTDFTMMTLLIPKRSRKELKNKFKKEEKSNPHLITQALKNQHS